MVLGVTYLFLGIAFFSHMCGLAVKSSEGGTFFEVITITASILLLAIAIAGVVQL